MNKTAIRNIFLKITYRTTTYIIFFLLTLIISIFLFAIFLQSNPIQATKFTNSTTKRILSILNIKHEGLKTTIQNGNIHINIRKFTKYKNNFEITGLQTSLFFSFSDILHGNLYKITIDNLQVNVLQQTQQNLHKPSILSKYHRIIPSVKMEIKQFNLNTEKHNLSLQNSHLLFNQKGYIFHLQTQSHQENYHINIALNSHSLITNFTNIPYQTFQKYITPHFQDISFSTISGQIELINSKNIKYSLNITNPSITKNQFIERQINLPKLTLSGHKTKTSHTVEFSNIEIKPNTHIKGTATIFENKQTISIKADKLSIQTLKSLTPHKYIQTTKFSKLYTYLNNAISNKSIITNANININLPIKSNKDLSIQYNFQNTNFQYHKHFSPIQNAQGTVEISPNHTTVFVKNGTSAGNTIQNTTISIRNKQIEINSQTKGSPIEIFQIILPNWHTQSQFITGSVLANSQISINLNCKNVLLCTTFQTRGNFSKLHSKLNQSVPSHGTFIISKTHGNKIETTISFSKFQNFLLSASKLQFSTEFSPHNLEFSGTLFNKNNEVITKLKNLTLKNLHTHSLTNLQINLPQNNLSINFNTNIWNIQGKHAHIPSIIKLIKRFKKQKNNSKKTFQAKINIEEAQFYNNISSFLNGSIAVENSKMKEFFLQTDFANFNIFEEIYEEKSTIEIPSLQTLIEALSINESPIKSGRVLLKGKHTNKGFAWSGKIFRLQFERKKFKLRPKEIEIKATFHNRQLKFKNIKIQDSNHTIFTSGTIFTDSLTTKTEIFYTPSKIEFLNEIPLLKDAMKIFSLGATKNGLLSFKIIAQGSIFTPEIKTSLATSTASTIWKFGSNTVMLPFILL